MSNEFSNATLLNPIFKNEATGCQNKRSRSRLCKDIETNDRTVRNAIFELRSYGVPIISTSKSAGYWLTTKELIESDPQEKEAVLTFIGETYNRIKKLRQIIAPAERLLSDEDKQMFLFDKKTYGGTY